MKLSRPLRPKFTVVQTVADDIYPTLVGVYVCFGQSPQQYLISKYGKDASRICLELARLGHIEGSPSSWKFSDTVLRKIGKAQNLEKFTCKPAATVTTLIKYYREFVRKLPPRQRPTEKVRYFVFFRCICQKVTAEYALELLQEFCGTIRPDYSTFAFASFIKHR